MRAPVLSFARRSFALTLARRPKPMRTTGVEVTVIAHGESEGASESKVGPAGVVAVSAAHAREGGRLGDGDHVVRRLVESLARHAHSVWALSRVGDGWMYGETRDNAAKMHPLLLPWSTLAPPARASNQNDVTEMLKLIKAIDFEIHAPPAAVGALNPVDPPSRGGGVPIYDRGELTAKLKEGCIECSAVELDPDMVALVDLLARNSHELWAEGMLNAAAARGDKSERASGVWWHRCDTARSWEWAEADRPFAAVGLVGAAAAGNAREQPGSGAQVCEGRG